MHIAARIFTSVLSWWTLPSRCPELQVDLVHMAKQAEMFYSHDIIILPHGAQQICSLKQLLECRTTDNTMTQKRHMCHTLASLYRLYVCFIVLCAIAVLGATSVNMLFARRGTVLVEIWPVCDAEMAGHPNWKSVRLDRLPLLSGHKHNEVTNTLLKQY